MKKRTHYLKTLSVRVRDKHAKVLSRMAFEVNQVWNAANEITAEYAYVPIPGVGYIRNLFTVYALQKLIKGIKQERGFILHSTTVQEVIAVHHQSRQQFKTDKLRWRVSTSSTINFCLDITSGLAMPIDFANLARLTAALQSLWAK